MIVRPYEQGDEDNIDLQESQSYMMDHIDNINVAELAACSDVWCGEHNGKIVAMGGIVPIWEGRGQAWMLIANVAGVRMTHVHKAVLNALVKSKCTRIEATVDIGFKQGVRWMKMLGFELESYMKAYRPDGGDMLMFARIRR